jgi:hypothetical protein
VRAGERLLDCADRQEIHRLAQRNRR